MRPQRLGPALSTVARRARERIADAGGSVVEAPVAAGLAWYIAHNLLGHHQPFFAPTAAAVSISKKRALRGQRAVQMIVGVLLGIGVGTVVRAVAGSSQGTSVAVAIAVAACIALVVALVVGGGFFQEGVLFVNQSLGAAILMIAVGGAATVSERVSDALIGGGVTLLLKWCCSPPPRCRSSRTPPSTRSPRCATRSRASPSSPARGRGWTRNGSSPPDGACTADSPVWRRPVRPLAR